MHKWGSAQIRFGTVATTCDLGDFPKLAHQCSFGNVLSDHQLNDSGFGRKADLRMPMHLTSLEINFLLVSLKMQASRLRKSLGDKSLNRTTHTQADAYASTSAHKSDFALDVADNASFPAHAVVGVQSWLRACLSSMSVEKAFCEHSRRGHYTHDHC